jgi:hypothetical protein
MELAAVAGDASDSEMETLTNGQQAAKFHASGLAPPISALA